MSDASKQAAGATAEPTIGEQIDAFHGVFNKTEGREWHDAFHMIFGRGVTPADEFSTSIAEMAFTNRLIGLPYRVEAAVMMHQEEAAGLFQATTEEIAPKIGAAAQRGLDAAEELKAYWGDLPEHLDAEDMMSRRLPPGWSMVVPPISGDPADETFVNRDALKHFIRAGRTPGPRDYATILPKMTEIPAETATKANFGPNALDVGDALAFYRRAQASRIAPPSETATPKVAGSR
ncbi:MAG: hypothetical protein KI792_08715 [Alphaproteobacteria bacterium]|nr:hypothetical protein [Alphaproteobacteria bacterium SS10]